MRGRRLGALCVVIVACSGSSKDEPIPDARGVFARFQLSATGSLGWADVPYPSDLYLSAGGTIDLATPPPSVAAEPIWQSIVSYTKTSRGFCTTCVVYFGIDGLLDRAKLPAGAGPTDQAKPTDAIVMIDADPSSPDHGKTIPLQYEWNDADKVLAVRPVPWIVLHRNRNYAVALTNKLRDADGQPLRAAPTFVAARDGGGDAAAARARAIVGPALDELVKAGVPRADVVSVAAFTTGDPAADPIAARKLAHAGAPPKVDVAKVWPNATESLDDLFGIPVDDTPGIATPAKDPALGKYASAHDAIGTVVYGSFASPHVREGAPSGGGFPTRDASGALIAKDTEKVPFLLAVPKTGDPSKMPVVIMLTGAASSAIWTLTAANTFARAGVATLGLDPPCQGARAKDAVDKTSAIRRFNAADGIPDGDDVTGIVRCIGLVDVPAETKGHPGYMLGFGLQSEADLFTAVRLATEGDVTALRKDGLATFAFDPKNVFLFGNHLGGVHVSAVSAIETDVAGVILNAYGASLIDALYEGPGERFVAATFFSPLTLSRDLDEVTRRYSFHPALDLFRSIVEPSEARALLPYVFHDPIATGPRPDVLVQRPALDESFTEEVVDSAVSSLGVPSLASMPFAPVASASGPVSANLVTAAGTPTAVATVFPDGMARMMWYPQDTATFEPPFNPPAKERPTPVTLKNPIAAVHAQFAQFVMTHLATGHASIGP
jgi:hypothetical protein